PRPRVAPPPLRMQSYTAWPLYRRSLLGAAAMLLSVATLLGAQAGPADSSLAARHAVAPVARAYSIQKPPVVNGRLDDEVWQQAQPFAGFVQRELQEGAPVTERTEVRILTDGQALYIGAWLYA